MIACDAVLLPSSPLAIQAICGGSMPYPASTDLERLAKTHQRVDAACGDGGMLRRRVTFAASASYLPGSSAGVGALT